MEVLFNTNRHELANDFFVKVGFVCRKIFVILQPIYKNIGLYEEQSINL
jgi:hypothetical protein